MAQAFTIDTKNFSKGATALKKMFASLPEKVDDILNANAKEAVLNAKDLAPSNMGDLRRGISAKVDTKLKKQLTSRAPYSAYMEFGTGKYAAQEVAKLPSEYKAYAAQFKGKGGGGTFKEFLNAMIIWVRRNKLGASYNISTKRKNRQSKDEIRQIAYMIAISILRKGVHAHPFMFPSFLQQRDQLMKDLQALINKFNV